MNNKNMSYLTGIFLIIAGIIFILSPSGVFKTIVLASGIIVLIISVLGIISSVGKENMTQLLGSSILGFIFSIILITNTESAIKIVPILLGIWLLITGLSTVSIMKANKTKIDLLSSPIYKIIIGVICLLVPILPIVITGVIIGVILVLAGISEITTANNEQFVYKVKVKK